MNRLVNSLTAAEYPPSAEISVTFALDFVENASIVREIDAVMESLASWPHGNVRVRRRTAHAGLRDNILGAWLPESNHSAPALFLEDDIELSPLWWVWVQASLRRYAQPPSRGLIGISLFTPDDLNEAFTNSDRLDESGKPAPSCSWQATHARARVPSSSPVGAASAVLFAQPVSWGALYFPHAWRSFLGNAYSLRRMARSELPLVPCPKHESGCNLGTSPSDTARTRVVVNRWGSSSWKRLLAIHMVAHGLYLAYPNLPRLASFTTNHVEHGVHLRGQVAIQAQRRRHRRTLVNAAWCESELMRCNLGAEGGEAAFELPHAEDVRLWDFYCALQPAGAEGVAALERAGESLREELPPAVEWQEAVRLANENVLERPLLAEEGSARAEVKRDEL